LIRLALAPEWPRRDDGGMGQLVRPHQGRLLAGVCRGLADRFGCSVIPVRILMLAGAVFFGLTLWIYVVLWILMPSAP
jgi:phage shock protein C